MSRVVVSSCRRGLAVFVLVLTLIAAVRTALFRVWYPLFWHATDRPPAVPHPTCTFIVCQATTPAWTIPAAVAIALAGIAVAALLYSPRRVAR